MGKKAVQVAYNLALATAKVIQAYRRGPAELSDGRIGTILNLTPAYPASQSEADTAAAHFAELWNNDLFMEAAVHGKFPEELVAVLKKMGFCGSQRQKNWLLLLRIEWIIWD